MGELEDNYNDLMDEIIEHREHREIASISNDSIVASSLSNFGIDIDNPEENEQYILQNQDPNAIIQGIGVEDRIVKTSESGLATSISKTRDSEFSPVIIEYPREHSLRTQSLLSETSEEEVNTEEGNGELNSNETDTEELENVCRKESVKEIELSTFDLALEKGYHKQAQIYYDDIKSKGLELKTKYYELKIFAGLRLNDSDDDALTHILQVARIKRESRLRGEPSGVIIRPSIDELERGRRVSASDIYLYRVDDASTSTSRV